MLSMKDKLFVILERIGIRLNPALYELGLFINSNNEWMCLLTLDDFPMYLEYRDKKIQLQKCEYTVDDPYSTDLHVITQRNFLTKHDLITKLMELFEEHENFDETVQKTIVKIINIELKYFNVYFCMINNN